MYAGLELCFLNFGVWVPSLGAASRRCQVPQIGLPVLRRFGISPRHMNRFEKVFVNRLPASACMHDGRGMWEVA